MVRRRFVELRLAAPARTEGRGAGMSVRLPLPFEPDVRPLAFTTIATLAGAEVSGHHGDVSSVADRPARGRPPRRSHRVASTSYGRSPTRSASSTSPAHGVSEDLTDRLLAEARRLFALPDADKDAVAMRNSPHFRGLQRGSGGETHRWRSSTGREQIDIGAQAGPPIGRSWQARLPCGCRAPTSGRLRCPSCLPSSPNGMPRLARCRASVVAALGHIRWAARPKCSTTRSPTPLRTLIKIVRYPAQADTPAGRRRTDRDAAWLTLATGRAGGAVVSRSRGPPQGRAKRRGNDTGASEATGNDTGGKRSDGKWGR